MNNSQTVAVPVPASANATQNLWKIDPVHSTVGFSVRHLMVAHVRGVFEKLEGTITYDAKAPEKTRVEVSIDAASVNTREPARDNHLRSADFFDAANHPQLRFRSTAVRRSDRGDLLVDGELTIRETTRPITLEVTEISDEQRDLQGARRLGASAQARLRRSEFGITFNKVLEAGGVAISDDVSLLLDVSLIKAE